MSSLRKSAVAPILLAKRQSGSAWPEIVSVQNGPVVVRRRRALVHGYADGYKCSLCRDSAIEHAVD